jgi:hypothetical protein
MNESVDMERRLKRCLPNVEKEKKNRKDTGGRRAPGADVQGAISSLMNFRTAIRLPATPRSTPDANTRA